MNWNIVSEILFLNMITWPLRQPTQGICTLVVLLKRGLIHMFVGKRLLKKDGRRNTSANF